MLRLLKSSFWSFLSILVRGMSGLAVNKLIALFYGPNGITLYAHFQNLISIVTTVPDGGVNIGIITYLAKGAPNTQSFRRYFWAGAVLNLLCIAAALILIFCFPAYYLQVFTQVGGAAPIWKWGVGFAVGALLLTLLLYLLAVLLSQRRLKWYVLGTSLMSVAGVVVLMANHGLWPLGQVLLAMLGAQAVAFFVMVAVLYFQRLLPALHSVAIPRKVFQDIGKFILMTISSLVCLKLVSFFVRDVAIAHFHLYRTGLWQAVVRVSESYGAVFTSVLGMLYYPRMAALVEEPEALRKLVRNTFYLVLPGLALVLLLVYLFREWVLLLLFNKSFVQADYLFSYQLLGDFFRMWSMVLTNLLVVRAHVKLYIGWQVCSALLYVALVYTLIGPFGLQGITMAHAIRYGVVLLLAAIYYHKYIRL